MAGSYNNCVTKDGNLRDPRSLNNILENGGDVWEAIEEMYGMIWFLAKSDRHSDEDARLRVEYARQNYTQGLKMAKEALRT